MVSLTDSKMWDCELQAAQFVSCKFVSCEAACCEPTSWELHTEQFANYDFMRCEPLSPQVASHAGLSAHCLHNDVSTLFQTEYDTK